MTDNAIPPNDNEILYAGRRSFTSTGTQYSNGRQVSTKELYDFIANLLSPLLVNAGFKFFKSKKSFVRKTDTGIDEIYMCSYDYLYYEFDFHFKKRIDKVQKIITALDFENGFNSTSNYKEQPTIWVCYSNITKSKIEAITFARLKPEIMKLYTFIENEILPYFDKLNSMDVLNQTFNYPEIDEQNHFSYFSKDAYSLTFLTSGLAVAKVIKDPKYQILLEKYLAGSRQNQYIQDCLKVVDKYLQERL